MKIYDRRPCDPRSQTDRPDKPSNPYRNLHFDGGELNRVSLVLKILSLNG